jgi:hypothetical protein
LFLFPLSMYVSKIFLSFNIVFLLVKKSLKEPKNVILKKSSFFLKKIMLRLQSPPPPSVRHLNSIKRS